MPVRGDTKCQGAVFIYKADERTQAAWDDAGEIDDIRIEVHSQAARCLAALGRWCAGVERSNAFLAIYSHMGAAGMSPTGAAAELVAWRDLAQALGRGVHTLWLIGCESSHVMAAWPTPAAAPVMGSMLVTSSSENWLPLVRTFGDEVSLKNIIVFNKMEEHLRALIPQHGDAIHYYDASDPTGWRKFVSSGHAADVPDVTTLTTEELSRALWGDWTA